AVKTYEKSVPDRCFVAIFLVYCREGCYPVAPRQGAAPSAVPRTRRKTMKPRLLLLVLLAAGASASAAQVYSWTDANGTKHFSDSPPPPTVNAQKIKVRGALTTDEGTQPATQPVSA